MISLLLGFALAGSAPAAGPLTVVCFGDSVTRGVRQGVKPEETFCSRLEKKLMASGCRVKVINAGVGGHTTADGWQRFDRDVISHKPRIVLIMFGLNDSWIDKGKTTSRLTAAQYVANLRKMVAALKQRRITPLLLTPNPVIAPTYPPERNVRLKHYVSAVRDLARVDKVPVADVYALFGELALEGVPLNTLFTDAMHPNPKGHEAIAALLAKEVKGLLDQRK